MKHPTRALHASPRSVVIIIILLILSSQLPAQSVHPRSIILLIGDGMGTAQVAALKLRQGRTNFDRFSVCGFSLTQSATHFVTESSAGGTALATGERTFNGAIAVDTAERPLQTALELALAGGRAGGVVVTSSITHATPAAFLAHVNLRKKEYDIAEQILQSGASVLIGGGRMFFRDRNQTTTATTMAPLLSAVTTSGFTFASTPACDTIPGSRLLMLLEEEGLPLAGARTYTLGDLTGCALQRLESAPGGFFLMVEGSQIDWACHNMDFPQLLREMEDFDTAIGRAMDHAETHPGTLVLVTADHETGGLTLSGRMPDGSDMQGKWTSDDHTGVMVPVFVFGPGAERFGGIHENREIGRMIRELLGH